MQFRCRIPAGWRFFVPLCNTQHGAYESDSSLHRRLFTDGNFEKNRRGGCAGSGPARRELQCNGKYGGRSGRWYKCRHRQRGKGVHDNRPDACGGKTARAAGRCRGGIRRAGIRGPRGACGIGKAAGDSRRGNAGRSAGGLRQPGFRNGGRTTGGVRRRAGIRSRGGRGFRGRTLVQHARHADRRRTSRYAGPRRSGRFRSAHRPKACARRDRPDRRRKTPRAAYAAVVKTAVHPFRAGVPQAAETQSGRTAPRGRRRTVHPMRPLCRTLSHAGDRARRRTAHRPGALHPLLRMRQRLRVRRTHVRNAFRCRSVAQLRPAETARNAYVI